MTQPNTPEQPTPGNVYGQPMQPQQPPPPKKKTAPKWLIIVALGMIALACTIGGISTFASSDSDTPTGPTIERPDNNLPAVGDDPEPQYIEPDADDFDLTVKTLSKECFGSAGCNIEFRIELAYNGNSDRLDPDGVYELTYEIRGGDDPYINTMRIEGDQYMTDESEFIGTPSSDSELRAEVVDITSR